jgi:hypothetical protein
MAFLGLHPLLELLDGVQDTLLIHQQLRNNGFESGAAAVIRIDRIDQDLPVLHEQPVQGLKVRDAFFITGVAMRPVVGLLLGKYVLELLRDGDVI